MNVTIRPGKATGTVMAPPSKSMAHRMLICAGLADGVSVVENIDLSEDIQATLGILESLGAKCEFKDGKVIVTGIGSKVLWTDQTLDCRESGSTLRFFVPVVLSAGGKFVFGGAKRLLERPLGIYEAICGKQEIAFQKRECGLEVHGKLRASFFEIPGNISSQFVTGLLFALPLLDGDSVLTVLPPVESKAYIDMTLEALQTFGIEIRQEGMTFYIRGNQTYHSVNVAVEGDYSNAAFLEALNLLGGNVSVLGLREPSLQGDQIYRKYYRKLEEENSVLDLAGCPDLGPILMGMAAAKKGASFTNTARLRLKESDRGQVMAEELAKFGVDVKVDENEIFVSGGKLKEPNKVLDSHNDHRIAMTLATLCTITGGTIGGAESVRKSFPKYFEVMKHLGIQVAREEETEE